MGYRKLRLPWVGWWRKKGVLGALFVVAAYSMAVSCFICAAVTFRSYRISPIISVAVLVAMALAETSWVSLRLVVSLLLPPTDHSYWLPCSNAFTYAVMASYYFVEGPGAVVRGRKK